jgi:hypothetical protein
MYENSGSPEDILLENEFLELRFLPKTAEVILGDKSSGAQWRSNPLGTAGDPAADLVTRLLMESQFSLEYADVAGVGMTLFSGSHSVERNAYEYTITDNCLEVRYTVGNLARNYLFPVAVPEKRMLSFLEKMEREDRRKVEASYRLYDINNLRPSDDKNTLLALYPDLNREKVYVLRDSTQEYMKAQIEEYFSGTGYTYEDYYADSARYEYSSETNKPAFNLTLRYTLDGKALVVNVPFDNIAYRPAFPITSLSLLPFMGAGSVSDNGYLLVPDGSGALIQFNNGQQNQIAYNINVYGWDDGMPREAVISDNKAPYPAFGIQKNGSALLCVIEDGSAYAGVRADVSGRNCSYNSVYARFDMIHGAKMDISGKSERAVFLYETSLPEGEGITLRFIPCAKSGYVGMAGEYRSWLLRKFPELSGPRESGVPVAVEVVGAVNKIQHRLGIPFDLPLKLTSYNETEAMIHGLSGLGWKNVQMKLTGWFNRSVEHTVPSKISLIGELGSKKKFLALVTAAEQSGYGFFPEVDFIYIKKKGLFDRFNLYRDAARYVNRKRIEKFPYSFVWFGERVQWSEPRYIARPASTIAMIDNYLRKAEPLRLRNMAFRSIGSKLSGDYHEKRPVSREAAMKMRQNKLSELAGNGIGIMLNTGYSYAVPWASFITDMALTDNGFGITDVPVPFYQIVLHGLIPYTGRAINLAEDYKKNLLNSIECGAGLYFSFMAEETAVLQETKFRQFYANEYEKWINDADALYQRFSADFSGLYAQAIEDHIVLSSGVTLTQYEDGTKVIVNAGNTPWSYNGTIINADDYIVLRGD